MARFQYNGPAELYHNNVKRIETENGGATITGDLTLTQHLEMGDNDEIRLGDSDDLKLYHNGTNSIIQDAGAGILVLAGDGAVQLTKSNLSENMLRALADGAVELYYDNVKKFETTSDGISVLSTADNGPVVVQSQTTLRTPLALPWKHL